MINPKEESTINITLKIPNKLLVSLEDYLNRNYKLIDFSVLADTSNMYENDPTFKKIIKESRKLKDLKLQYINDNNYKYIDNG